MVSIENETLRVTLIVARGCEIYEMRHKKQDMDVIAHTFRELPALDTYIPSTAIEKDVHFDFAAGGWPVSFPMGFTPGFYAGVHHTAHSEVSTLPWDYTITEDSGESVTVAFFCRCRRLPFSISRHITLQKGCAFFLLSEVVRNESPMALEYAWGHHPTIGTPFLTQECEIDLPPGLITTFPAGGGTSNERRFAPSQRVASPNLLGIDGVSISLKHPPPPNSKTMDHYGIELSDDGFVAVRNREQGFGFGMTWEKRVFPYLWVWEVGHGCMRQPLWGREYLMGFEPFNSPLGKGVIDLAGKGILPTLADGASETVSMRVGFCDALREFAGYFIGET